MSIDRDGLKLVGIPKLQCEHMERKFESPLPVYGEPFERAGWRQVAALLRRQERKCRIPALAERIKAARIMAGKMPAHSSPWDAMHNLWEIETATGAWICDGVCRRFMREACYTVLNKEFVGRQ